jgi:hypothetical protein
LSRVVTDDLLANSFEHAASLHRAAAGGCDQPGASGGMAVDVGFNVAGDDAQGPGLGGG